MGHDNHHRGTEKQGFPSIGKVTINQEANAKKFETAIGFSSSRKTTPIRIFL
jgi:hypothetical protein